MSTQIVVIRVLRNRPAYDNHEESLRIAWVTCGLSILVLLVLLPLLHFF
jgi:hypothetical protein